MFSVTMLENDATSCRTKGPQLKSKKLREKERNREYEELLGNDIMADVLLYNIHTSGERIMQMDALVEVQRRIPRRSSHPHVLLVSANTLTMAVMASQLAMHRWKISEAQTLTEATAILQRQVERAQNSGNAAASSFVKVSPTSRHTVGVPSSSSLTAQRKQRQKQKEEECADEKGGKAAAFLRGLESPHSETFEEDDTSCTSLSSSMCSADREVEPEVKVLDDMLPRLVIVDSFTHEPFNDILDHLRYFDRKYNLGLIVVLMLHDNQINCSPGMLVLPKCTTTMTEAYSFGYDLVLRRSFDYIVMNFFTELFMSAAGRWSNDMHRKSIIGNYRSMRHILLEEDKMFSMEKQFSDYSIDSPNNCTEGIISRWQTLSSPIPTSPKSPVEGIYDISAVDGKDGKLLTPIAGLCISQDVLTGFLQPAKSAKRVVRRQFPVLDSARSPVDMNIKDSDNQDGDSYNDDGEKIFEDVLVDDVDEMETVVVSAYKNELARVVLELEQSRRSVELLKEEMDQLLDTHKFNTPNENFLLPNFLCSLEGQSDSFVSLRKEQQIYLLKQRIISLTEKLEAYEGQKRRPMRKSGQMKSTAFVAGPQSASSLDLIILDKEDDHLLDNDLLSRQLEESEEEGALNDDGAVSPHRSERKAHSLVSASRSKKPPSKGQPRQHESGNSASFSQGKTKDRLKKKGGKDGRKEVQLLKEISIVSNGNERSANLVKKTQLETHQPNKKKTGKARKAGKAKEAFGCNDDNNSREYVDVDTDLATPTSTEHEAKSPSCGVVSPQSRNAWRNKLKIMNSGGSVVEDDGKQTMESVRAKEPWSGSKTFDQAMGNVGADEQQRIMALQEEVRRLRSLLMKMCKKEDDIISEIQRAEVLAGMSFSDMDTMKERKGWTNDPLGVYATNEQQEANVTRLREVKLSTGSMHSAYRDAVSTTEGSVLYREDRGSSFLTGVLMDTMERNPECLQRVDVASPTFDRVMGTTIPFGGEMEVEKKNSVSNSDSVNRVAAQCSLLTDVDTKLRNLTDSEQKQKQQQQLSVRPNESQKSTAGTSRSTRTTSTARVSHATLNALDIIGGKSPQVTENKHSAVHNYDNVTVPVNEYLEENYMSHHQAIERFLWAVCEHHMTLRDAMVEFDEKVATERRRNDGKLSANYLMSVDTLLLLRLTRLFGKLEKQTHTVTQDRQRRRSLSHHSSFEDESKRTFLPNRCQKLGIDKNGLSEDFSIPPYSDDADCLHLAEDIARLLSEQSLSVNEVPKKMLELLKPEEDSTSTPYKDRVDVYQLRKVLAKINLQRGRRSEEVKQDAHKHRQKLVHFKSARRPRTSSSSDSDISKVNGNHNVNATVNKDDCSLLRHALPFNMYSSGISLDKRRHLLPHHHQKLDHDVVDAGVGGDVATEVSKRNINTQCSEHDQVEGIHVVASGVLPPLEPRGLSRAQYEQLQRISSYFPLPSREPQRRTLSKGDVVHATGLGSVERSAMTHVDYSPFSSEELAERIMSYRFTHARRGETERLPINMTAVYPTFSIPVAAASLPPLLPNTSDGARDAELQRFGRQLEHTSWIYGVPCEQLFPMLRGAEPTSGDSVVFLPVCAYSDQNSGGRGGARSHQVGSSFVRRMIARMDSLASPATLAAQRLNAQLQFSMMDWRAGVIGRSILNTQTQQRRVNKEAPPEH